MRAYRSIYCLITTYMVYISECVSPCTCMPLVETIDACDQMNDACHRV